jgi:hypothetical protein
MDGTGKTGLKVVWLEGHETHSAKASRFSEDDGFLKFDLWDGRTLRLSRSCVLKIEEGVRQ